MIPTLHPCRTISLGKYGSFPSNLVIGRPYYTTFELLDRASGESFSRLRVVQPSELYADLYDKTTPSDEPTSETEDISADPSIATSIDFGDGAIRAAAAAVAESSVHDLAQQGRQTLSMHEIEALKRDGASAGKELITKLIESHTAIDQKTSFSLAKYKLLKTKKYIRRFSILPFDPARLNNHMLEDKDATKVLEMREEMMALIGCLGNVHYGGDIPENLAPVVIDPSRYGQGDSGFTVASEPLTGRWMIVDDTTGLLTAAMAERMGILYPPLPENKTERKMLNVFGQRDKRQPAPSSLSAIDVSRPESGQPISVASGKDQDADSHENISKIQPQPPKKQHRSDLEIHFAPTNTLTLIHSNTQPNLSFLNYFDYDFARPNQHRSNHPLASHLHTLSWMQLVSPKLDQTYKSPLPQVDDETLASWKASRRGDYHKKRRRWARTRYIVDSTRQGGFSGLVSASTMDPTSILRTCLPFLAGGAPIAIYSQSVEPLMELADCFSQTRRSHWHSYPPPETIGQSTSELERWPGNKEYPINPSLLLNVAIHTSRVRRYQVHPGRTHPLMTSRGGAEGYILTGTRAVPVEGGVMARGKFKKRRLNDGKSVEA